MARLAHEGTRDHRDHQVSEHRAYGAPRASAEGPGLTASAAPTAAPAPTERRAPWARRARQDPTEDPGERARWAEPATQDPEEDREPTDCQVLVPLELLESTAPKVHPVSMVQEAHQADKDSTVPLEIPGSSATMEAPDHVVGQVLWGLKDSTEVRVCQAEMESHSLDLKVAADFLGHQATPGCPGRMVEQDSQDLPVSRVHEGLPDLTDETDPPEVMASPAALAVQELQDSRVRQDLQVRAVWDHRDHGVLPVVRD